MMKVLSDLVSVGAVSQAADLLGSEDFVLLLHCEQSLLKLTAVLFLKQTFN